MRALSVVACLAAAASGQSSSAFEVASIRMHTGPLSRIMNYSASGPRVTLEAYGPAGLIREAYNLEFYEIVFPPSLAKETETYYNIVARAPGETAPSRDDLRQMLQTLLAERFNLRFHREPREMPVYLLTVGKGGPKIKPSAADTTPRYLVGVNGRNQSITATRYPIADLARGLHQALGVDRPVLDRTGLSGEYDFRIEATPAWRTLEFGDLSVFTAVQQQLGLRLEPGKALVEVVVVDRFDKPSEN